MATQVPFVVHNENIHFQPGKSAGGAKADVPKSEQKSQKIRKPLVDISKSVKPFLSVAKVSSLKERSVIHDNQKPKGTTKSSSELTEEEIERCNEWANEGIEHTYFSGNDLLDLHKNVLEELVKKKVNEVISALREWAQMSYGLEMPGKELGEDPEEFMNLDPDPEVILPVINVQISTSVGEEFDDPVLGEETYDFCPN